MDFAALAEKEKIKEYEYIFPEYKLFFKLRRPTGKEYRDYQRQAADVTVKNGKAKVTDTAIEAPLMFFNQLCISYEIENGEGSRVSLPEEWREELVANPTRLAVIRRHLDLLEGEQNEKLGNWPPS